MMGERMRALAKKTLQLCLVVLLALAATPLLAFASEDANTPPRENSWRYIDGDHLDTEDSLESLASSSFVPWSLTADGYLSSDGSVIPHAVRKGIDVSEHNRFIDWEAAKNDGVQFAIIRCGYGSDFPDQDDLYWQRNVSECERLGIPYGVYLYSYAQSIEDAQSEADHVLRLLSGHNPSYPVFYDLEENSLAATEHRSLLASMATAFCNKVTAQGYEVGIYANLYWWNNFLTDPVFENWTRWVAQYNYRCDYTKNYQYWQCTSKGTIKGIDGYVDLNFELGYKPDDVELNDWYVLSGAYDYVTERKLMGTYSYTNLFGPYDSITRGQVATILWRMAGEPSANSALFDDVDYGEFYGPAISWARATGVINGYQDSDGVYRTFGPNSYVTREQLAAMLANYASKINHETIYSNCKALDERVDANLVSSWAHESMGWCVDKKLVSGVHLNGQDYIQPQSYAWRASMASMVMMLES